ncbi:class I SAM-dependent methyltransferase [Streptomyces uncialis]|uniref:class I SAM-dependent methyltransferase n=1 Tax=Streptomyces uncialis TaxID=1048205 RepID=UPI003829FEC0
MTDALTAVERTSLLTAATRGREHARPDRLYNDPYAARLAGDAGLALLTEAGRIIRPDGRVRAMVSTPDFGVIRTRLFDDFLRDGTASGRAAQIVLAASGMDTRVYRLPWPPGTRLFEIDRPAVLAHKAERLREVAPRADHRTVPADLVTDEWEPALLAAGYDPARPSLWVLEGLLHYLPPAEVHRLLDRVAAMTAPGSGIAADVAGAGALTCESMRPLWELFARWGSPFRFGDDHPVELFARHGFSVGATEPGAGDTAAYGRWPDPVPDPSRTDVARGFYVRGTRDGPRDDSRDGLPG